MATLAPSEQLKLSPSWAPAVLLAVSAAVLAALLQSTLVPLDCDVSWLITLNEKMLSGLRPYIDIIEPNPPASIWLYTTPVWTAHQLGLRPEALVVSAFIAASILSCAAVVRISAHLENPPNRSFLVAALSFFTLLLPLGTFAQREHAALLLALPALAGLAVLAERRPLSPPTRLLLGVATGLVIVIKPHFAVPMGLAAIFSWARSRSFRPMIAPAVAASATLGLYGVAVAVFTPHYLQLVPMFTQVYLPLREQWPTLLRGPVFVVPLAIYALVLVLRPRPLAALPAMFLVGSAGFTIAALVQMKGYLNHALPGMALGFVALALVITSPGVDRARAKLVGIAGALLAALQIYAMASIRPLPGLNEAVLRVAPPHPRVIALGPDLLTGHPLVRNVDGTWAGSRPALFIAAGARRALAAAPAASRARLMAWYQSDLQAFSTDVAKGRPDVVLVDARPDVGWLRGEPVIAAALAAYRPAARAGDVELWVRR